MTIPPGRAAGTAITGGLLCCMLSALAGDPRVAGQTLHDVAFSEYAERASNAELVRRLRSPLEVAGLEVQLRRSGSRLAEQSVDLAQERFVVYVPSQRRAGDYGLLVFVPPWQDARIPDGWSPVLERFGVIFVSAARSGNAEDALARREPLALLAAANIMRRYPVDPERVYIGGFSGGSRIALRLALAYPDIFRGAILNAGSDPIGEAALPLPPRDLFSTFQDRTHLIYLTGDRDTPHASEDLVSIRSMHQWCVFSLDSYLVPRLGHEVASPEALSWALARLLKAAPANPARLASCRAPIEASLAVKLQEVATLIAADRHAEAEKLLKQVDGRFGGLAAPQSVELAAKL